MSKDYGWKRFWCPREGSYSLADQGLLADPEAEYGQEFNPDLTTFDRLQGVPCLAMLGEPGIGKSWTLSREALSDEATAHGAKLLRFDLRQFGSEGRLFNALFESEELRDWKDGSYDLHLYLDSVLRHNSKRTQRCIGKRWFAARRRGKTPSQAVGLELPLAYLLNQTNNCHWRRAPSH